MFNKSISFTLGYIYAKYLPLIACYSQSEFEGFVIAFGAPNYINKNFFEIAKLNTLVKHKLKPSVPKLWPLTNNVKSPYF